MRQPCFCFDHPKSALPDGGNVMAQGPDHGNIPTDRAAFGLKHRTQMRRDKRSQIATDQGVGLCL